VHVTGGRRSGDMQMACHAVTRSSTSTVQTTSNVPEYSKAKNIIHLSQRDQIVDGRKRVNKNWRGGRGKGVLGAAIRRPPAPPPLARFAAASFPSSEHSGAVAAEERQGRAPSPREPGSSAAAGTRDERRHGNRGGAPPRAGDERRCGLGTSASS
jgi:hypothetical protein